MRLLLTAMMLAIAAGQMPQGPAPPGSEQPDFVTDYEPDNPPPVPVVRPADQSYQWPARNYDHLNLFAVDRYVDLIRYEQGHVAYARPSQFIIVQFALTADGRSAQLLLLTVEGWGRDPVRQISRMQGSISREDYDRLQQDVMQAAAGINRYERRNRTAIIVCSHGRWSWLDVRATAEAGLDFRRRGGCDPRSTTYRAGELVIRAAERALGRSIERWPMLPAPENRADSRPDR